MGNIVLTISGMSQYLPTIGLEIHVELKTRTKMFCGCKNDPQEENPNVNVCPICMGHPGTLPTPNKEAIKDVIKVGLALGGQIAPVSKFDRKNYFYPDLPKAYQISQYDQPFVSGGSLCGINITRIHLEEDTASLAHDSKTQATLVDFNRSSLPLMELVTEPEIHSPEKVAEFAKELQLILRYLGVSDADMEKGQMRIEPNVSVAPVGSDKLGKKVEVKNINSFRAALEASRYEIDRQIKVLEEGGTVTQENRGWDENKKQTVSQRSKEDAHDYRYFPEPDIPPIKTEVFDLEDMKRHLPELPDMKRVRFAKEFGLSQIQVEALVIDPEMADFFESAASEFQAETRAESAGTLWNYLTSDLRGLLNEMNLSLSQSKVTPEKFSDLIALLMEGKIMSRQAKDILRILVETGEDPHAIVEREGMTVVRDEGEINKVIGEVISENVKAVQDLKSGKEASLMFLVGQAMKKLKGKGDPKILGESIKKAV